jgi:hypothetical protein
VSEGAIRFRREEGCGKSKPLDSRVFQVVSAIRVLFPRVSGAVNVFLFGKSKEGWD